MSMDLEPQNPTEDAPRDDNGDLIWGRYNVTGWGYLWKLLNTLGVDTSEFSGCNDGEPISDTTCKKVAYALEAHIATLDPNDPEQARDIEWHKRTIPLWRTCGGYKQY